MGGAAVGMNLFILDDDDLPPCWAGKSVIKQELLYRESNRQCT